jgi:hypothetical protein
MVTDFFERCVVYKLTHGPSFLLTLLIDCPALAQTVDAHEVYMAQYKT